MLKCAQIHLFRQCLILKVLQVVLFVCFLGFIFCPTKSDSNFSLQCMVGVLWVQQYPLYAGDRRYNTNTSCCFYMVPTTSILKNSKQFPLCVFVLKVCVCVCVFVCVSEAGERKLEPCHMTNTKSLSFQMIYILSNISLARNTHT